MYRQPNLSNGALLPFPCQPEGVPWPTREWAHSRPAPEVDRDRLESALARAFASPQPAETSATNAVAVIHRGAIVAERYAAGFGPDDTQPSWSMAKGVLHALVGILVRDGKLDIRVPAAVPEWSRAEDPRRRITLDQLLRMSSGLRFVEDYVDGEVSDVIEMLFGAGRTNTGAFAAALPLAHEPDTLWSYSSGTSNIVSRIVGDVVGRGEEYLEFMRRKLLDPLGMTSAIPKFDDAGNFIGSSFLFCTPRDFARFGLLYLRDGVWDGRRILPQGWVDYGRTATPAADRGQYGAHFWLGRDEFGSFACCGYECQYTVIVPALDLVVVRSGKSDPEKKPAILRFISEIVRAFSPNGCYSGLRLGD